MAVSLQYESRVCAAIFEELILSVEYDQRNLTVTKYGQLHSFLDQTTFAFVECNVTIPFVRYRFDSYLFSSHCRYEIVRVILFVVTLEYCSRDKDSLIIITLLAVRTKTW